MIEIIDIKILVLFCALRERSWICSHFRATSWAAFRSAGVLYVTVTLMQWQLLDTWCFLSLWLRGKALAYVV